MIHTVTGNISSRGLGKVLIHEHIRCASNDMLHTFGRAWLDEEQFIDYASQVLILLKQELGVGLFVDGTPIDLGRDIRLLQKVSERAGVPIVASTGLYWFPACVTWERSPEEIAEWLLKDCREGAEETDVRPGILKCATDQPGLIPDNIKRLTALGIVQKETGLPVYVHSRYTGNIAQEQIDILCSGGAAPEKIILGHAANRPDADHLEAIPKRGCYLVMDQCHCFPNAIETIGSTLAELCRRGYTKQLLLSNDLCIYNDCSSRGRTGLELTPKQHLNRYSHLFREVYPAFCRAGGRTGDWETMLCENSVGILDT